MFEQISIIEQISIKSVIWSNFSQIPFFFLPCVWLHHTCAAKGWKAQENRLIQILNPQAKSAFQQSSRHHVWWSSPWQIYTHIINRKYPNLTCSNILFCKRISREESWWDPLYLDTPIKKMDTSVFLPKRRVSGECVWAHCFLLEFVYKFKSLGDQKKYFLCFV